jgi:ubiquinone/menaquinone biosynthesis C-methylase UbiE
MARMTSPMQQPAMWSAIAEGYEARFEQFGMAFAEEALRLLALAPGAEVFELACGPAGFSLRAAPRVARVVAGDFSPGMIEQAKAAAARAGAGNVEARVMDAQALDLPDASVDAAACLFGFMFFPDRARAFAELRRVLRPGGTLLVATWAPIERRPAMKIGFDAVAEVAPEMPRPDKGDLQSEEDCVAEASAAGFTDVEVTRFSSGFTCASGEEYYAAIEQTSIPLQLARKRLGDGWPAFRAKLVGAVERRLPADRYLAAEALFTRARR